MSSNSVSKSQRIGFAALVTASILSTATPSRAISISVVESNATRTAIDLIWGESTSSGLDEFRGFRSFGLAGDLGYRINLAWVFEQQWPVVDYLVIDFSNGKLTDRTFETADVSVFQGVQILPLASEAYGARFVLGGAPYDTAGVPDAGSMSVLLSSGLLGTAVARRWLIRK